MKHLIILSLLFFSIIQVIAQDKIQIKTTSPSPAASFEQEIGSALVKVAYSRPLARNRKIMGDLVPYNQLWRTGASDCTTITTDEELVFGGAILAKGSYSLFSIPGEKEWTIIVNTDTSLHGDSGYDQAKDVVRFKVPVEKTSHYYETFTIEINDINSRGEGFLKITWEHTTVQVPIKSTADERTMTLIQNHVIQNQTTDANLLFQAANYYITTNRDKNQAITWLEQAEIYDPQNFYYPNLRQKLLGEQKKYSEALVASKKALVLAKEKNSKGTIKSLEEKIKEYEILLKK
ncbi:DUF2911 domain-containing protein [Flavobacterium sp. UBA6135]|uniref:DUF2911 domain-containing protein n=1 Tax=Flavobacterium sp. UBA6135 TaxID=1946553 RepID=UPI0025C1D212|nr:DUF2911 domain-containing protein [Flavobacterium sp. UBA6135]